MNPEKLLLILLLAILLAALVILLIFIYKGIRDTIPGFSRFDSRARSKNLNQNKDQTNTAFRPGAAEKNHSNQPR